MSATSDLTIQARFEQFHDNNPHVYQRMVELCRDAKAAGATRLGVGLLIHVIRWENILTNRGREPWKINQDFASRYARLLMEQECGLQDFFEVRELRSA